jgi:hypothetical protein
MAVDRQAMLAEAALRKADRRPKVVGETEGKVSQPGPKTEDKVSQRRPKSKTTAAERGAAASYLT